MSLKVVQLKALSDNYIYVLHESKQNTVAVVDPAEAQVVSEFLGAKGWSLDFILNTHHHYDHVGANLELKDAYGAQILGPAADRRRIPGIDVGLQDGQQFRLGGANCIFYNTPGHTKGHGVFYFPKDDLLFCGDTLFSLGCGRLFEGSPQQMWDSLLKLRNLPDNTKVCCAHEYTHSNAIFARHIDPDNEDLAQYIKVVEQLRNARKPTVPSLLATEKKCNPFLRADFPSFQERLGMKGASAAEVLAFIRQSKDQF